jgi:hypothetical protein
MPLAKIDRLFTIWKASTMLYGGRLPFASSDDLLAHIDTIPYGHIPWQAREMSYPGVRPETNAPLWMDETYTWYMKDARSVLLQQLSNPDIDGRFDAAAYQEFKPNGARRYKDFMSATYAWDQSVRRITCFIRDPNMSDRSDSRRIRSTMTAHLFRSSGEQIKLLLPLPPATATSIRYIARTE